MKNFLGWFWRSLSCQWRTHRSSVLRQEGKWQEENNSVHASKKFIRLCRRSSSWILKLINNGRCIYLFYNLQLAQQNQCKSKMHWRRFTTGSWGDEIIIPARILSDYKRRPWYLINLEQLWLIWAKSPFYVIH